MKRNDLKILNYIHSGEDNKAIEELYRSEFGKILSMVKSKGGDEEDAKDIFQDTVIVFYKQLKLGKYNDTYEVGGFVFTIAKNLWINKIKRSSKFIGLGNISEELTDEEDIIQYAITEEREKIVNYLFSQLGEMCKKLLVLYYYQKLPMGRIALEMGYSSEAVAKSKKYKCKQFLVEIVKSQGKTTDKITD